MPKPGKVRLRHLLILLTALGLLPVALIGAWGINALMNEQRQDLEYSMRNLARALASAVDAELDASISALRAMSYNPALVKGDIPGFYDAASDIVKARPHWAGVVLNDGQGNLLFKTALPLGAPGGRVVDPDSLTRAIETHQPVIGRIAKGQVKEEAVPIRYPVLREGRVAYVLTAAVKPDRILAIVKRQQVPDTWVISVHDATDLRVARSKDHDKTVATGISATLAELVKERLPEGSGVSHTLEGTEVITAYARIPQHDWMVVIGAPTAPIKQLLLQKLTNYVVWIGVSLLICVALALYISRRIAASIDGLTEQAIALGQGRAAPAASHPVYEIDQIGHALQTASKARMAVEQEREELMASLNRALMDAEQAARAKDEFLAILGHELRNPLAPMVSALAVMDLRGDTGNAKERAIMQRQVAHMKRLVDDLLDVSRIIKGKLEIHKTPVDIRQVVERALEALQPFITARGDRIAVSVPGEIWVDGDETRLVQVLTNLLSNALRFDPHGEIALDVTAQDGQMRLSVRDHGAGMAPEMAEQVFRPFFQAPQPLARTTGGLGLGLAIVKGIVELHGGSVFAASAGPGQGCTFSITLPLASTPRASAAPSPPLPADRQRARIMVVDDNADAASMTAEVFKMIGHQVAIAHDAESALELFREFSPAAVFIDIGLPGMNGFELASAIRDRFPAWNGRLIALTGYGQQADKALATQAGFDQHLTKPADIEALMQAATG